MFKLGKFTGQVLDEAVEVELQFGVKRMCQPMMFFPSIGRMYPDWINIIKTKFFAIVAFEDEEYNGREKALLVGFRPMETNGFPAEGIDNFFYTYSKVMRLVLDEAAKTYTFDLLTGGVKFIIGKDGDEPGVLGNILKTKLETLCDKVKTAADKAQSMATKIALITVPTSVGPSGVPANAADFTSLAADFATVSSDVATLKSGLDDILSVILFIKE